MNTQTIQSDQGAGEPKRPESKWATATFSASLVLLGVVLTIITISLIKRYSVDGNTSKEPVSGASTSPTIYVVDMNQAVRSISGDTSLTDDGRRQRIEVIGQRYRSFIDQQRSLGNIVLDASVVLAAPQASYVEVDLGP
jgi:hypothetical protein